MFSKHSRSFTPYCFTKPWKKLWKTNCATAITTAVNPLQLYWMVTSLQTFIPLSYQKVSKQFTLCSSKERKGKKCFAKSAHQSWIKILCSQASSQCPPHWNKWECLDFEAHPFLQQKASKQTCANCVCCRSQNNISSHKAIQKKHFKLSLTYSAPATVSSQNNSWLAWTSEWIIVLRVQSQKWGCCVSVNRWRDSPRGSHGAWCFLALRGLVSGEAQECSVKGKDSVMNLDLS